MSPERITPEQIEQIARVAHEANRAYCETLGDTSQVPFDAAPTWQRQSAVDGVRAIAEGRVTRPSQSHQSWLAEKDREGWKYGEVKDAEKKTHPCFVPFAELPREQQAKDHLFFGVVKSLLEALA